MILSYQKCQKPYCTVRYNILYNTVQDNHIHELQMELSISLAGLSYEQLWIGSSRNTLRHFKSRCSTHPQELKMTSLFFAGPKIHLASCTAPCPLSNVPSPALQQHQEKSCPSVGSSLVWWHGSSTGTATGRGTWAHWRVGSLRSFNQEWRQRQKGSTHCHTLTVAQNNLQSAQIWHYWQSPSQNHSDCNIIDSENLSKRMQNMHTSRILFFCCWALPNAQRQISWMFA